MARIRNQTDLTVGQLRRYVRLGTEAVYRVCDWDEDTVLVEVVTAPGLAPGREFRFDASAVLAMPLAEEELSG